MSNLRRRQQRAKYARTTGDFLINEPPGFPSEYPPVVWWWGDDSPLLGVHTGTMSAVNRATSLIVNTLSAAPWRHLTGGADPGQGITELPAPRWILDPQLFRPDGRYGFSPVVAAQRMPRGTFWSQWIRSCLWRGVGFLIFEEQTNFQPVPGTMRVLSPDAVGPISEPYVHRRIGDREDLGVWVETDMDGRFEIGGRTYRLLEITNPLAMVDETGLAEGVLAMHAKELGLAEQAITYAAGTLRSGIPAGYLKTSQPNYTAAQAEQLRTQWLSHHGGDRRSIAVLNATTEFTPISMSPVDIALIEQRKMSLNDIANAFGIPSYLIGGGSSEGMTYSNAESRSLDFRSYTLLPWARAIEDVLSSLLPSDEWVEIDFRGLLRADTATRYQAYSTALADGWMTVDEVRRLENLSPLGEALPGGRDDQGGIA